MGNDDPRIMENVQHGDDVVAALDGVPPHPSVEGGPRIDDGTPLAEPQATMPINFELQGHEIGLNVGQLIIAVGDERGAGGAYHDYGILHDGVLLTRLHFQEGPIGEAGINGITVESLLRIVEHRLECFQQAEYACTENQVALDHVRTALYLLHGRTSRRMKEGVEGSSNP